MDYSTDSIAAIATAPGEAGIAVIRVSGPTSLSVADFVFKVREKPPSAMAPGTFAYGHVINPSEQGAVHADEAICLVFRSPRSYTGEDVVELQCHGGRCAAERTLQAVISAGARLAAPGEFTRRAFLNGRMDLLQAEAVLDLIRARSDAAASMAVRQLEGDLTNWTRRCYDGIISTLAELESGLDFSEEDVSAADIDGAAMQLEETATSLKEMLKTWDEGRFLREGALLVIAGHPNAGKSTLMNRLLNHDRSIVSETPGTTRDVIEDAIVINGIPVRVADTAGLRETDCLIEKEGIRRARRAMQGADAILYVVDGSMVAVADDLAQLREAGIERTILVVNKSDLGVRYRADWLANIQSVTCSALTDAGIDSLLATIATKLSLHASVSHPVMISRRHKEIVTGVLSHVLSAERILKEGRSEGHVLAASQLHSAAELLGTMTGSNYTDELLDSIFSKFCIGK
jgi:tRNA modification GTPase